MNVLILAQYFPPDLGGSATRAYNVAKGLVLNGCRVTVIAAFPHYPHGDVPKKYRWKPFAIELIDNIRVIRTFILPLESKGLTKRLLQFTTFTFSSLFALPFVGSFDVVWAGNPDIVVLIPALVYGKIKRKPVVANVDDLAIEDLFDLKLVSRGSFFGHTIEFFTRFLYGRMSAVTPISPGYVNTIAIKYGVNKSKIHVVYGGVDLGIFKPKFLNVMGHSKKDFIVLYSGAFSVAYDFDQVLKAAMILGEKNLDIKFILQGKGELADHIRSRINQLKLRNVVVIDGLLSRSEVADLLNEADVLIQPLGDYGKPHMGISTKLYEYQAMGKPIICCSTGQPGKYVKETCSGVVVAPGDYEGLANAVLFLKQNPDVARSMGFSGRCYVEDHLSIEAVGFELSKILERLTLK